MNMNHIKKTLTLYYPTQNFLSFSVTGGRCERNCAHCGGHYLKGMIPVSSGKELYERCREFYLKKGKGVLISGGCGKDGSIDFSQFLDAIEAISYFSDFYLNIHTGFLGKEDAETLTRLGVDSISMDVVGSEETLKKVYGLNKNLKDYKVVFDVFKKRGVKVSPHICVGLHFGEIKGEYTAIDLLSEYQEVVKKLIFIVLLPTKGTKMENISPPSSKEVIEVFKYARKKLKNPLILGCMRPRNSNLELSLIELRIDGIVNPLAETKRELLRRADSLGLTVLEKDGCCSF